ncbi:MAG TPA: tetratricopeptide repeat protein [Lacipirellulaceae bacterium]|nr:tetratricopeptide repeat protein [Lacipirellulaceae bacterium]
MPPEPRTAPQPAPRGPAPLAAAVRQRLQKTFEHAKRCVEKNDFDYAHQLFTQCVAEDPSNVIYLQAMIGNLHKKYANNKKGAKLAALKIKSHRSALAKAAEKGLWTPAFTAGCAALALNPWDVPTLLAMADACNELGIDEGQLTYLRSALDVDGKDPTVNRRAALALQRMGQFDQAIACWHRVEQAKPHDEEAQRAISNLSVEKTIHQGGYDPELLGGAKPGAKPGANPTGRGNVARLSRGAAPHSPDAEDDGPPAPPEQRHKAAIAADPANAEHYFRLADLYLHEGRLDEAQRTLEQAAAATGGGNLQVRERLEDVQLRRAATQSAAAQRNFEATGTAESKALADRARAHANQVELEVFAARVDREPNNPRLQFELAVRLKRAGKVKPAITAFQAARSDPKRRALVLVELGECFQKIEQYKLALSHYEQALEACEAGDNETRKLALYRAGVLATGLRELDRAERHLAELAGMDFGYRDVSDRLDKVTRLRDSG